MTCCLIEPAQKNQVLVRSAQFIPVFPQFIRAGPHLIAADTP